MQFPRIFSTRIGEKKLVSQIIQQVISAEQFKKAIYQYVKTMNQKDPIVKGKEQKRKGAV